DHRDPSMVLGAGARERYAPDVDELFEVVRARVLREMPYERVEVHRHEVEREQVPVCELPKAGLVPGRQDPAEEARVQGLDPTPEPVGHPREFLGRPRDDMPVGERTTGSSRSPEFDAES